MRSLDAGLDAGLDVESDAGSDAGLDVGSDAGSDAGLEAGLVVGAVAVDSSCHSCCHSHRCSKTHSCNRSRYHTRGQSNRSLHAVSGSKRWVEHCVNIRPTLNDGSDRASTTVVMRVLCLWCWSTTGHLLLSQQLEQPQL